MSTSRRWIDWKPANAEHRSPDVNLLDFLPAGAYKTYKTVYGGGFVGFVGSHRGESQKIEAEPADEKLARASAVLGWAGVRLIQIGGVMHVGIWSDLDSPVIRAALHIFDSSKPLLYLDAAGIPPRYKLR